MRCGRLGVGDAEADRRLLHAEHVEPDVLAAGIGVDDVDLAQAVLLALGMRNERWLLPRRTTKSGSTSSVPLPRKRKGLVGQLAPAM
jgi:hypothetical protein